MRRPLPPLSLAPVAAFVATGLIDHGTTGLAIAIGLAGAAWLSSVGVPALVAIKRG
jgi:hypothetical protein